MSPQKKNPITPKKRERGMSKFNMFQDAELRDKDFKYVSPSKQPLNNNIADPEYKPFNERNSQESMYSYPSDNDKTNKSEDDSPHRRKLIRQSPVKRVKFTSQQQKAKVEEILNASAEIDAKLDSQIKHIQEIRKQTEDALSQSDGVRSTFNSAQKQF